MGSCSGGEFRAGVRVEEGAGHEDVEKEGKGRIGLRYDGWTGGAAVETGNGGESNSHAAERAPDVVVEAQGVRTGRGSVKSEEGIEVEIEAGRTARVASGPTQREHHRLPSGTPRSSGPTATRTSWRASR